MRFEWDDGCWLLSECRSPSCRWGHQGARFEAASRGKESGSGSGVDERWLVQGARQGFSVRPEGRRESAGWSIQSCYAPDSVWWRTEPKLGCGNPFDDAHGCPADRGNATRIEVDQRKAALPGLIFGEVAQEFKTDGQQTGASSVGEEAEVTDAYEATWQHMQKEAAQELVDGQRHRLLPVAMCGIAPSEGDVAMVERDESVVGDGDAVGVSAEIAQGMLGSSEGALGVDDPVVAEQGA